MLRFMNINRLCITARLMSVDEQFVSVGSPNFDSRSFSLSDEAILISTIEASLNISDQHLRKINQSR